MMKIDMEELQKQRKKELLNDGKYTRVEIIMPRVENFNSPVLPIIEVENHDSNTLTLVGVIKALDRVKESIREENIDVVLAETFVRTETKEIGDEIADE